ncbi:hypothetical protein [Planktothricoides raciborskii]|uniref:Uncharacterized protein n=1 Tax=Planktothricoides raciborskii GIHE-MW2 TaxID=2792601 RepID=A0AAU8J762_9CYAN
MNYNNYSTLSCRFCQHYEVEGRRGGICHLLNVSVQGNWQACPLAIRSFVTELIAIETISQASDLSVNYEKVIPLKTYNFTDRAFRKKVS